MKATKSTDQKPKRGPGRPRKQVTVGDALDDLAILGQTVTVTEQPKVKVPKAKKPTTKYVTREELNTELGAAVTLIETRHANEIRSLKRWVGDLDDVVQALVVEKDRRDAAETNDIMAKSKPIRNWIVRKLS